MPAVIDIEQLEFSWATSASVKKAGDVNDLSAASFSAQLLAVEKFQCHKGEHTFLTGPSGSGKSTLLNIIAGFLLPQKGSVNLLGQPVNELSGAGRDQFRVNHIGLIFQQFNLLPYLSMLDNTLLPCRFSQQRAKRALENQHQQPVKNLKEVAEQLLKQLGLSDFNKPVAQLSVGQQQRVAVARAMIGKPEIIIADEPTSALDKHSQTRFISLLKEQAAESGATILFVSHDDRLMTEFSHVVELATINKAVN